jgi:hypothetical protein
MTTQTILSAIALLILPSLLVLGLLAVAMLAWIYIKKSLTSKSTAPKEWKSPDGQYPET